MKSLRLLTYIKKPQAYFLNKLKNKSRVYIVPNKHGLYLGSIIFALFLMALSYGNNVLLFLDFFIFSVFIYAQFSSHYNLQPLAIKNIQIQNRFASEDLFVEAQFENSANYALKKISLSLDEIEKFEFDQIDEIEAKSLRKFFVRGGNLERGFYQINKIRLFTQFPLDIFYVWRFLKINLKFYIYPNPLGSDLNQFFKQSQNIEIFEDYSHHSQFTAGDKFALIDWKNYAKTSVLKIKNFSANTNCKLEITVENYLYLGKEAALSQICKWLLQANTAGLAWQINIKGIVLKNDESSIDECLMELARYD